MRMLGKLIRRAGLVEGADRRVLPVVPVTLVYNLAFSTFWVYVGVFAVDGLGWRPQQVGLLFLISAPPAAIANYLSGRISDVSGGGGRSSSASLLRRRWSPRWRCSAAVQASPAH
jgi:predicted MFS family arabinose efflux permease